MSTRQKRNETHPEEARAGEVDAKRSQALQRDFEEFFSFHPEFSDILPSKKQLRRRSRASRKRTATEFQ